MNRLLAKLSTISVDNIDLGRKAKISISNVSTVYHRPPFVKTSQYYIPQNTELKVVLLW